MPAGDGTGPWGEGPMTGRGLGYCAEYPQPGFSNPRPGFGRGFGRGRGRGFARRRFFRYPAYRYPTQPAYPARYPVEPIRLTKTEQKKILEEEKKELELEIKAIQDEIAEIQKRIQELK